MAILIRGMQMPESCMECPLFNGYGCTATNTMFSNMTNVAVRTKGCPLVEVPKGAILIDASEIEEKISFGLQEPKTKYDDWKVKREQIHVGDEVKHKQHGWKAFVTNISEVGYLTLMWGLGGASKGFDPENFEKTGKHCAEIEELIKKISEAQHNEEE